MKAVQNTKFLSQTFDLLRIVHALLWVSYHELNTNILKRVEEKRKETRKKKGVEINMSLPTEPTSEKEEIVPTEEETIREPLKSKDQEGGEAELSEEKTNEQDDNDASDPFITPIEQPRQPQPQQQQQQQASKKRKKKQRTIPTPQELQQERYDKLLYTAQKQLHKHAKTCKAFMVQKCIRKLKQQSQTKASSSSSLLIGWKELDLDLVVNLAVRQLGLWHANPNPEAIMPSPPPDAIENPLVAQLLQQTRFQSIMEEWNQKVTEYRRWCMKFEQGPPGSTKSKQRKKRKQQQSLQRQEVTSMFCSLGGDDDDEQDGDENAMSAYGPAAGAGDYDGYHDDYGYEAPKKKNRKGQRARRAKAMAIQAKKEGRKRYQSLNWRSKEEKEKKQQEQNDLGSNYEPAFKREEKKRNSRFNDNSKSSSLHSRGEKADAAAAHPSWAAKQQQKSGIVAFQGTKITF